MAGKKTGTREWSDSSVNIQLGCEHGCRYCYARYQAVKWRKWCTDKEWLDPGIIQAKVTRSFLKRAGVVMFPTTHDVTLRNLPEALCVLGKLLNAGNKVLLVSKPHIICIINICKCFGAFRDRLIFRFTIGSSSDQVLSFWEPNAPGFPERAACLKHACHQGFRTSVSCEPFLDSSLHEIVDLYEDLEPYISVRDGFWIGKLREFDKRIVMDGVTSEEDERFVKPLRAAQSDEFVRDLYQLLKSKCAVVKWKDSIREVVEK